ncbi:unnamed protein product [Adineta ricciae]|uniref:Uncharacterized protein n=1 Tax=Adineta ricciae TaxID=249248 RepID=A0A815HSQ7_ADIRI|nr:unnamed protein product [Adineta ricciae]CAF1639825.1 unnamed protein product [Adineta ricciae]
MMVDASTQTMSYCESQLPSHTSTITEKANVKDEKEGNAIDFDSAILSIGRAQSNQVRSRVLFLQLFHPSNNQSDDLFCTFKCRDQTYAGNQQMINVVDQMIAQPHVSYSLLPKHFKPKQQVTQLKDSNRKYQSWYYEYSYQSSRGRLKSKCITDDHRRKLNNS